MGARGQVRRAAWAAFATFAVLNLVGLFTDQHMVAAIAQPLAATSLLTAFVASVRGWTPTFVLTGIGLAIAWLADTVPPLLPIEGRLATASLFMLTMIAYAVALALVWARSRDSLRILLAVPYAGVVIALFVACADNAGSLMPVVLLYAVALTAMSFLAAGVNSLTWVGGTLLLASSSVLGMTWFLPGAWVPHAEFWVMLCYFAGHACFVLGILRLVPAPARAGSDLGGATLVIVES